MLGEVEPHLTHRWGERRWFTMILSYSPPSLLQPVPVSHTPAQQTLTPASSRPEVCVVSCTQWLCVCVCVCVCVRACVRARAGGWVGVDWVISLGAQSRPVLGPRSRSWSRSRSPVSVLVPFSVPGCSFFKCFFGLVSRLVNTKESYTNF